MFNTIFTEFILFISCKCEFHIEILHGYKRYHPYIYKCFENFSKLLDVRYTKDAPDILLNGELRGARQLQVVKGESREEMGGGKKAMCKEWEGGSREHELAESHRRGTLGDQGD